MPPDHAGQAASGPGLGWLPAFHKKVHDDVGKGAGAGNVPATMALYQDIIDLRMAERSGNRA